MDNSHHYLMEESVCSLPFFMGLLRLCVDFRCSRHENKGRGASLKCSQASAQSPLCVNSPRGQLPDT